MGYYDDRDVPYYYNVADNYVLFDRFFSSARAGSRTNHVYWVTGTSGGSLNDSLPPGGLGNLPTIFDRLQAAGGDQGLDRTGHGTPRRRAGEDGDPDRAEDPRLRPGEELRQGRVLRRNRRPAASAPPQPRSAQPGVLACSSGSFAAGDRPARSRSTVSASDPA